MNTLGTLRLLLLILFRMETMEGFPIRQSCISLSKSYSRGAIRKSYVATPIFAKKKKGVKINQRLELSEESSTLLLALAKKVQTLEKEKSSLGQTLKFSKSAFDGAYKHYKQENVRELSQLISCYLLEKPHQIDRNKIYGRVHSCYYYLKEDYDDNPDGYYEDMRMLLATCLASRTWFTNKQYDNIEGWHGRMS